MTFQEQVDNIMDEFEFERVHEMMEAVDWTWGDDGVPDVRDIRRAARKRLYALRENSYSVCGGFTAMKDEGVLRLFWGENSTGMTDEEEVDDV